MNMPAKETQDNKWWCFFLEDKSNTVIYMRWKIYTTHESGDEMFKLQIYFSQIYFCFGKNIDWKCILSTIKAINHKLHYNPIFCEKSQARRNESCDWFTASFKINLFLWIDHANCKKLFSSLGIQINAYSDLLSHSGRSYLEFN